MHSLGHPDDWDQAMGPGGALEALVRSAKQGLTRSIGVTGHGWTIAAMHRRSLARFDFDSVLLPYNFFMAGNERYRRRLRGGAGHLPASAGWRCRSSSPSRAGPGPPPSGRIRPGISRSKSQADIDRGVHWVLGLLPDVFINTAGDLALLPRILDAASRFTERPSNETMSALQAGTRMTSLFGLPT